MSRYEPRKPKDNWFKQYLGKAVSEYEIYTKIELPNALHSKLQKIVETEFEYKRKGYYFTIGFIDETCRLCKKCTRPLTCDNSLSRPSWKLSPELQAKYNLKEGQGILLIGPTRPNERALNYDRRGEKIIKIQDEISNKYNVKVSSLPTSEIAATWMTVLQCMWGCRVYSNFSRRWSCVPFCPSPDETRKIIDQYDYALILNKSFNPPLFNMTWLGSNLVRDLDQKLWATRCYGEMNKITLRVENYLLNQGFDVYTYGMSPCHVCAKCTHPRACKQPNVFRFSADACGIDIYCVAIKAGAKFEIPPKTIVNLFEIILIK